MVVDGVEVRSRPVAADPKVLRDSETGKSGMRVTGRDASGSVIGSEYLDVTDVAVGTGTWLDQAATIELTADLVSTESAQMQIGVRGPGRWKLKAGELEETFTVDRHLGHGGGMHRPKSHASIVDVIPSTRITAVTEALDGMRILSLVARPAPRPPASAISEAVRAARQADIAIVAVGLTDEQETEGVDKTSLALPGEQDALVTAVAAAARRTVVVINAATPVLMPWLRHVDAVIWVGLPGQEAGAAVTAALTGEVEPAGRLVTTIPARDGDGPAWSTTPIDGRLNYLEGSAVGYRGWYGNAHTPAFWFGHGLGYSTWAYRSADIERDETQCVARVHVCLTNTGEQSSRETIQAYFQPADEAQPVRLIGWFGAVIPAGQTTTVDVPCDARLQRKWDPAAGRWSALREGSVLIARGLGDIRLTVAL